MNKKNLELVIELRRIKEKKIAEEANGILNRLNVKKEEIKLLLNKKEWLLEELRKIQINSLDIPKITCICQNISRINQEISELQNQMAQMHSEYKKKISELLEERKKRKIIEKLRERILSEQRYNLEKQEQRFLDEISNNRFFYKNM